MPIDDAGRASRRYAAVLLAAALAACAQFVILSRSDIVSPDSITFITLARQIGDRPIPTLQYADQHPGYPLLILAGAKTLGSIGVDDFWAFLLSARLISNIAGILCVVCVWHLALRLYNERVAAVAAILTAILPLLRQNAADVLADSPHLFFYLLTACFAVEGLSHLSPQHPIQNRRYLFFFAIAGASSAAAYLIRPEGLSAAAVVAFILILAVASRPFSQYLFNGETPRNESLVHRASRIAPALAALSIATILVALPYMLLAGKITSKKNPLADGPVVTPAAEIIAARLASAPPAPDFEAPGLRRAWQEGDPLPGELERPAKPWLVPLAALAEFSREMTKGFRVVLLFPLAAGLFATSRPRPDRKIVLIALLAACHFSLLMILYCMASYISNRHVMPIVALAMPTIGAGVIVLAEWSRLPALGSVSSPKRVACVVAVLAVVLLPYTLRPLNKNCRLIVEAADWVRDASQPGDLVLSTSNYAPFYARLNGPVVGRDTADLPSALRLAPEGGWPFLVLEFDPAAAESAAQIPGYSVAREFTDPQQKQPRIVIYRPTAQIARRGEH